MGDIVADGELDGDAVGESVADTVGSGVGLAPGVIVGPIGDSNRESNLRAKLNTHGIADIISFSESHNYLLQRHLLLQVQQRHLLPFVPTSRCNERRFSMAVRWHIYQRDDFVMQREQKG